jgi:hypothetical protein
MTTQELRMMMLDIDGVLTRCNATPTDVLAAAQQLAVSAIGDLRNNGADPEALHRAADGIAEQIRAALHKRIDEGKLPEW